MPRPCKPPSEIRKRWDALYVTADERAAIAAAAEAAGQSVSRYLVAGHQHSNPRHAHAMASVVRALVRAEAHLESVAQTIATDKSSIDAVLLQSHLLAIERGFRRAALPWAACLDDGHKDTAP